MILKKLKIIMVEDNPSDAVLIERQIRKIVAHPSILLISELEALKEAAEKFRPDVVLSDYQLGEFTGFDVLKFINSLPQYIPLIFVTGTIHDEELAATSILTGATGYILKKNINALHKKLLPHFRQIVEMREEEPITTEHKRIFEEMQSYLTGVRVENKMIRASYLEMKRTLEKLKSLDK